MQNAEIVKRKIAAAAEKSGRKFDNITVVCATKTRDIGTVADIKNYGFSIAVENRVQEFLSKYKPIDGISWQIVGQLQSNKVKYIADKVDMIQSLDRLSLADEIDRQCKAIGKVMDCLAEVNISGIDGRGGVKPSDAIEFINSLSGHKNLKIKGLMTVLPICQDYKELAAYCKKMKKLFDDAKEKCNCADMVYLSMGMSDDFECAIENGANMIRLGRILFGERNL